MSTLRKILSGGQTGVDQAALQAAIDAKLEHGGWCPPDRLCEEGRIPNQFLLKETPIERHPSAPDIPRSQRTIRNVSDSEASLIFLSENQTDKGTRLALDTAKKLGKPFLVVDPEDPELLTKIRTWVDENEIEILSVGGPSERNSPGIYQTVYALLNKVFRLFNPD